MKMHATGWETIADRCRALLDPAAEACVLQRSDLHVAQTTSAVIITV
jgi:hypothetical protein